MQKEILMLLLTVFLFQIPSQAQKFLRPFELISHKKTSYIYKENGKEIEGKIKKLKRKKGLFKEVNIKNEKGKKMTIPIESINYAYLPQSGLDKIGKFDQFLGDATQWDDGLHDKERIKNGYAYFEKTEVMVKKKKRTMLMQLLNPGICSKIKVYHDPIAKEGMGIGFAGVKVTGGKDKSYYIKIGDKVAFKLKKKNYKKMFDELFGNCKEVKEKYSSKKWSEDCLVHILIVPDNFFDY